MAAPLVRVLNLSFLTWVLGAVATVVVSIVGYGLYNVYLHPLRKYPGPFLWTAYRLPYLISAFNGQVPFRVLDFHKQYGPVVRIAPNELVFTEAAAWDDIQGRLPDRTQNVKDIHVYGPPEPGKENSLIIASDAGHARLRRIYGPAFTVKAVEEQGAMLMKYANLLVSSLNKAIAQNPVQDMSAFWNFTSFDLTGEFAFDEPFHCLEQAKYHFFVSTICTGVIAGFRIGQVNRYKIWDLLKPLIPKSAFQAKTDMDNYTTNLVDKRRERGYVPGKTDVFNYLLKQKNEEDQLTRAELIQNAILLVVAGSETTATLLTGVTWQLCKNPSAYRKVVSEVRSTFKSDNEITVKAVNDLPYMIAVLTETLRMFPPTPFPIARIVISKQGQKIAGHDVPYETRVSLSHYAAYRYEKNFARPMEFHAERWLSDRPAEFESDNRDVLQPFHTGPRACLGKNLAYAEMRLLLAKFLWHFDFELADPNDRWLEQMTAFAVWNRSPLMIQLKPVQK